MNAPRLIDHRQCGGGGCHTCQHTGTEIVPVAQPADLTPFADEMAFHVGRETCACYEGYPIHAGVAQCTHAGHRDDGEWCEPRWCPRMDRSAKVKGGAL